MLKEFLEEWFPKTEMWDNIAKFILESGIEITEQRNPKWLTGYTNIGESYKPHHKNDYTRYMEESMFMLHDVVHQIFTLDIKCSEQEYVKRQIYGELFTFYLTEWSIPNRWTSSFDYRQERGCYSLMTCVLGFRPTEKNIIDHMWDVFIDDTYREGFIKVVTEVGQLENLKKYSKMFKEDLENSRKNHKFVPKNIKNYCMVGQTSQNHIDFFEAVSKGAVKNIKRDFKVKLPKQWI